MLVSQHQSHSDMPLKIGVGYLIFTFVLFYLGPMEWQLRRWWPLSIYFPTLLLMLFAGFKTGSKAKPSGGEFRSAKTIFYAGSWSALILLYPTAVTYTGRTPWQVFEALADQRDAYAMLREQLEATQGFRGQLAFIRSLLAPLIFAVLPLGILYWKSLTKVMRVLMLATIASTMILSALRGTTRELADVVIVGGSALLISIYRNSDQQSRFIRNLPKIALSSLLVVGVLGALTARTEARLAGTGVNTCIGGGYVCPSFDSPFYGKLPDGAVSALATITGYFSQGYYGLGLALDHEWVPTWGLGHSPAIGTLYRNFSKDDTYFKSTYIERINQDAWSSEFHWSSAITWFASDVSFWGVPVIMILIGMLWARSWVDAVYGHDDKAAIFFCIIMMAIFYLPANNQMMNTFENYATTLFWGVFWFLGRHNRSPRRRLKITDRTSS